MTTVLGWRQLALRCVGGMCVAAALALAAAASPSWLRAATPQPGKPAASVGSPLLIVGNLAGQTRTFSAAEFAGLPKVQREASVPHSDRKAKYEGVLLERLLREAGIQPNDPAKPGKELARSLRCAYLLVEATDGYQVVFSLPEVFGEGGGNLLLADRRDGKPLEANAAPYQLIVAGSASHERWARQVRRILVRPASASPFAASGVAFSKQSPAASGAATPTSAASASGGSPGRVFLVGTGPGAPDLITLRAANVLRSADLVYCYSWMKDELAPLTRPGVVEVASPLLQGGRYFGKAPAEFPEDQRERAARAHEELAKLQSRIGEMLKQGKTVVFADNGDPMIFSPWSWVPEVLEQFQPAVVPGLSSFNAANAALKRSVASLGSVVLSSGDELGSPDAAGRLAGAVAFFTHRAKFDELLPKLQKRYPADTPAAIVTDVSYPTETVTHATLGTIRDALGGKKLPHLYLFYVGDGLKARAFCR